LSWAIFSELGFAEENVDEQGDEDVPPSDLSLLIGVERVLEEVGVAVAKKGDEDGLLAAREKVKEKGLREEMGARGPWSSDLQSAEEKSASIITQGLDWWGRSVTGPPLSESLSVCLLDFLFSKMELSSFCADQNWS